VGERLRARFEPGLALGFFDAARPAVACFFARAIGSSTLANDRRDAYFLARENMPSLYSTISPATADAATVSGDAR
jgi:hypothetical protein